MTGFPQPPQVPIAPKSVPSAPQPRDKLSNGDIGFIMQTNLIPQHYEDPTVMNFIGFYIECRDVKQASRETGILTSQGKALLNRQDIATCIGKITEAAVMRHNLDPGEIVEKAKEIMQVDMADFQNEDGTFKDRLSDIPAASRRAIKKFTAKNLWEFDANGMKVCVGKIITLEVWDKMKSIQLLGQEKSLFKETKVVEHDLTSNMKDLLLESKKRGDQAVIDSREPPKTVIDIGESDASRDRVREEESEEEEG
jgi:hypothetical protein